MARLRKILPCSMGTASLLELQGQEGGWAEDSCSPGPGAYATGQVLYALKMAGQPCRTQPSGVACDS